LVQIKNSSGKTVGEYQISKGKYCKEIKQIKKLEFSDGVTLSNLFKVYLNVPKNNYSLIKWNCSHFAKDFYNKIKLRNNRFLIRNESKN